LTSAPKVKSHGVVKISMSDENLLEFVDTNILIYAHDTTAGDKHRRAMSLMAHLWDAQCGCISMQVLQEFYVNVTRKIARPLAASVVAELIADFATWRVHSPGVSDIGAAISIQGRYDVSFWDALILQSANRLGCSIVWSEDLNAGQIYGGVRVLNPFTA
jgi:predicted nucleic acid-binding protein